MASNVSRVFNAHAAALGSWRRTCTDWLLSPIYQIYGRRLRAQVLSGPVPRHVGIILDGNRRYGSRQSLTDARAVYAAGADKLDDLLAWCIELSVPAITLWVLSTDNLRRRPEEISDILSAIETKLNVLTMDPLIRRARIRIAPSAGLIYCRTKRLRHCALPKPRPQTTTACE